MVPSTCEWLAKIAKAEKKAVTLTLERQTRPQTPLPDIDYVDIRWRRKAFGYYEYVTDTKDPNYKMSVLNMNKRYKSKKFFVEVLAHEMVHHYQFMNDEPMGHGPSFEKWSDKFSKKGLKLFKVYGDEE